MPGMHLPDICWGEAGAGCLPCNYHDLIRQNRQVHTHGDPPKINTPPPRPSPFDHVPNSASDPHFQPLTRPFLFSRLPFSCPSCSLPLLLYLPLHVLISSPLTFFFFCLLSSHLPRQFFWDGRLSEQILCGTFSQLTPESHPLSYYIHRPWPTLALCNPNVSFPLGR